MSSKKPASDPPADEQDQDQDSSTATISLSDIENGALRAKLSKLGAEIAGINRELSALEAKKKPLNSQMAKLARGLGILRLDSGSTWDLLRMPGRVTLSEERLLLGGVTVEQLDAAKSQGHSYYMVKNKKTKKDKTKEDDKDGDDE